MVVVTQGDVRHRGDGWVTRGESSETKPAVGLDRGKTHTTSAVYYTWAMRQ
jgi:hypothetical protein